MTSVQPGQVWKDNDKRMTSRHVFVLKVEDGYAICTKCNSEGLTPDRTKYLTQIRLDRFRPTSTGYVLVRETTGSVSPN
jgi:hypothetical protein